MEQFLLMNIPFIRQFCNYLIWFYSIWNTCTTNIFEQLRYLLNILVVSSTVMVLGEQINKIRIQGIEMWVIVKRLNLILIMHTSFLCHFTSFNMILFEELQIKLYLFFHARIHHTL